jgi:hypothetical protein
MQEVGGSGGEVVMDFEGALVAVVVEVVHQMKSSLILRGEGNCGFGVIGGLVVVGPSLWDRTRVYSVRSLPSVFTLSLLCLIRFCIFSKKAIAIRFIAIRRSER